jgi:hypothetical protein
MGRGRKRISLLFSIIIIVIIICGPKRRVKELQLKYGGSSSKEWPLCPRLPDSDPTAARPGS